MPPIKELKPLIELVLHLGTVLFLCLGCKLAAAAVEMKEAPTIALSKPAATLDANAIQPKLRSRMKTDSVYVARLAFSPDSRYLAIGDEKSGTVIVRHRVNDREQARFNIDLHLRGPYMINWDPGEELIWSPDGRFLTNGVGTYLNRKEKKGAFPMTFWDPMTGAVSYRSNIFGSGKFNKDGSKLVVREDGSGRLFIYDTNTWTRQPIDTGLAVLEVFNWTARDEILAVGVVHPLEEGRLAIKLENGEAPARRTRLMVKLDPSQKVPPRTLVLGKINEPFLRHGAGGVIEAVISNFVCNYLISQFSSNRLVLSCTTFIAFINPDTMSLEARNEDAALPHVSSGDKGMAFSADGRYLYLVGTDLHRFLSSEPHTQGMIIDARTGTVVGNFPASRYRAIAISPDGRTMAVGNGSEVLLYEL